MPIRQFFKKYEFDPDTAAVLRAAFEHCVKRLELRDPNDNISQVIAQKIIEAAVAGERDAMRLCQEALQSV